VVPSSFVCPLMGVKVNPATSSSAMVTVAADGGITV
jgi:hypothetical protein